MADETKPGAESPAKSPAPTPPPAPSGLGTGGKVAIVLVLAAAVAGVIWLKTRRGQEPVQPPGGGVQAQPPAAALPRLVDLGADKCIPCKMMAPILQELKKEYAGRFEVSFIDVWQNPEASKQYGIKVIPTQIFYGADGRELFRHEGFFSKEDILNKWKELGVGEFKP